MIAKPYGEVKTFFPTIRFAIIDFSKSDVMFLDKMLRPVLKKNPHARVSKIFGRNDDHLH